MQTDTVVTCWGFTLNYQQHKFDISANYFFPFISLSTARKRSCGKVMFLHLFVSPHRVGPYQTPPPRPDPLERTWDQTGSHIIPPERKMGPDRKSHHIPSTDIQWHLLKRAVRILLEWILVRFIINVVIHKLLMENADLIYSYY